MRFPKTYIGEYKRQLDLFRAKAQKQFSSVASEGLVSTGTTVFSMLTEDEKSGIIVSDGRVSMENFSMDDDFRKIKECRIGFIGFAGSLGGVQMAVPDFLASLNKFCDARERLVTASGAANMLYQYHCSLAGSGKKEGPSVSFLALFWDFKEKKCYLYLLEGMAHLRKTRYIIGSGTTAVGLSTIKDIKSANSRKDLLARGREVILSASSTDNATNRRMFYGLVENGVYSSGEEVL